MPFGVSIFHPVLLYCISLTVKAIKYFLSEQNTTNNDEKCDYCHNQEDHETKCAALSDIITPLSHICFLCSKRFRWLHQKRIHQLQESLQEIKLLRLFWNVMVDYQTWIFTNWEGTSTSSQHWEYITRKSIFCR